MTKPTREEILARLGPEPIGIRELANRLGCRVRDISSLVRAMERAGAVVVTHPDGAMDEAERQVSLPAAR